MREQKILVIDDDADILSAVHDILQLRGYKIFTSPNTKIAEDITTILPDLILLDCWLPGEFGDDLCKRLKSDPATAYIPIILFSADMQLKELAQACGANDYILKPFDIDEILLKVEQHCI